MKKLLVICLTSLLALVVQAQNIMVVHPHNAAPQQFDVAVIDSMTWEDATTLHIYLHNQAAKDFAITHVDSLTWIVTSATEPPITIGEVQLGEGEAFIINDSLTEVRSSDCSVKFTSTVVDKDTKLVIRKATSVPPVKVPGMNPDEYYDISEDPVAVDVSLGNIHKLDGIVEVRIPYTVPPGEMPGVAWYNEETMAWEPIDYDYDTEKGEVVIWSNHLSILECYRVKNKHTSNAQLAFYSVPYPDNSADELIQMVDDAVSGTMEWGDFISKHLSVFKQFGFDITWSAFNAGGVQSGLYEKANKVMGVVGTLCASYDIIRAGAKGDNETAGINTMKLMYSKMTSGVSNAIATSIMTGAMCALAIVDYALNQMWESSWKDRQDIYRRCYDLYYSRNSHGLKNNYRSATDWYKILLPIFQKGAPTIDGVNAAIAKEIDDYVNAYWNLPIDDQDLYWIEVGGPAGNTYRGGLSEKLKQQLCDNHKTELYGYTLQPVFVAIGKEMRAESYEILKGNMQNFAKLMNQVVKLNIKDSSFNPSSGGKSGWEGCTVRFKDLPKTIADPKSWQVKLDEKGQGTIRFRLYAYTSEKLKPMLELVDKDGKVQIEQEFVLAEGNIDVELPAPLEFLISTDVEYDANENYSYMKPWTNCDSFTAESDASWLSATVEDGRVVLHAYENTGYDRTAHVTITGYKVDNPEKEPRTITVIINVTQKGTGEEPEEPDERYAKLYGNWVRGYETTTFGPKGEYKVVSTYGSGYTQKGTYTITSWRETSNGEVYGKLDETHHTSSTGNTVTNKDVGFWISADGKELTYRNMGWTKE